MRPADEEQYPTLDPKPHAVLFKDTAVLPVLLYKSKRYLRKFSIKEKIAVFHLHWLPLGLLLGHLNICTTPETRGCIKTAQHFKASVLKSKQQTGLKY